MSTLRSRGVVPFVFLIALTVCTGDAGPTGPGGSQGSTGAAGSDGAQGSMGVPGISGYEIVSQSVVVPAASGGGFGTLTATVDCPAGKMALGGGINTGDDIRNIVAQDSYPNSSGTGWVLLITSGYPTQRTVEIYAICALVA